MTFPNIFTLFFINYIKNRTILSSLRQLRLFWYGFCAVCNRTAPILSFCSPFENSGLLFRTGSVLPLYSLCTASVLSSNLLRTISESSSNLLRTIFEPSFRNLRTAPLSTANFTALFSLPDYQQFLPKWRTGLHYPFQFCNNLQKFFHRASFPIL